MLAHGAITNEPQTVDDSPPPKVAVAPQVVSSEQKEARDREKGAAEDPMTQRDIDKVDNPDVLKKEKKLLLKGYASLRYRYRRYEEENVFGDSDTRVGGGISWKFHPQWRVFANAEIGVSLLDEVDALINPKGGSGELGLGDTIYRRLLYAGIETPRSNLTFGKNWSTYYKVASYTDRFQGTGGNACGVYNAGTDGGPSGTGRADRVLQTRFMPTNISRLLRLKPVNINLQVQHGNPIPQVEDRNYGTAIGLSAQIMTTSDFSAGIAYNFADIPNNQDPVFRAAGIDGDNHAFVFGVKWFNDDWLLSTTVARMFNHETTDEDIYFNGTGWEVYAQKRIFPRWWVTGGWNWQGPDAGQEQAGDYEIKNGIIGLRYTFDEFRRMIYTNIQFSDGSTASGESPANFYTVGVRWDFP